MNTLPVVLGEAAERDLNGLYAWIADASGERIADEYLNRLRDYCLDLALFPSRGRPRPDIGDAIRAIGFERRVLVVYRLETERTVIIRILYAGRSRV